MDILTVPSSRALFWPHLRRCFEACANGAFISHLGIMLAREAAMLRVNIQQLPAEYIPDYLERVGWPGNTEELKQQLLKLCSFVDSVTVCLDIGAEISPRVGLECFWRWQPGRERRWESFLDSLVVRGLCTREKADALLSWPGYTDPASTSAPWPAARIAESLLQGPERFSVLNRELTHIKVTCDPRHSPRVKAYFGFLQAWLVPETENRDEGGGVSCRAGRK